MKKYRVVFLFSFLLFGFFASAQTKKSNAGEWIKVSEDEDVTISYNSNIITGQNGNHFVWVKAVYHTSEWQKYFSHMIGSNVPVMTTRTKAEYDEIYSLVRIRQVICYSKAGKKLYDSGDDSSAGWGFVNASDPVGIVGEFLSDKNRMY